MWKMIPGKKREDKARIEAKSRECAIELATNMSCWESVPAIQTECPPS